jgi:hypothetical protein
MRYSVPIGGQPDRPEGRFIARTVDTDSGLL